MTRTRFAVAAALALAAAPASAAQAVELPVPTCGMSFTDKAGDASADTLDITGGWLSYNDDGSVSAYIQVKNLSRTYPAGEQGMAWRMTFKAGGKGYYVGAFEDVFYATSGLADPYFDWGTYDNGTETFEDIANGKLYEGPNGVIKVQVPKETGVKDGDVLTDITGYTAHWTTPLLQEPFTDDDKVEGAHGHFSVAPCGGGELAVTASGTVNAAAANKARRAVFSLSTTDLVTDLKGTVKQGGTVLGSGSLASLQGAGKLAVALRKKARKGAAALLLEGTDSSGARTKATLKVRFS